MVVEADTAVTKELDCFLVSKTRRARSTAGAVSVLLLSHTQKMAVLLSIQWLDCIGLDLEQRSRDCAESELGLGWWEKQCELLRVVGR